MTRIRLLVLLTTLPVLGCGGNKAEAPKEFAPPPQGSAIDSKGFSPPAPKAPSKSKS